MPVILTPEQKRKSIAQLRVTDAEAALLRECSRRLNVPLAVFVREVAVEAAQQHMEASNAVE